MAVNRTKTVEYPFKTRITTLATNTTLGTATELDFADVEVYLEPTRTIRFVRAIINVRDAFTAAADFDAFRCGVQINAVAFADTDTTITLADSGDHTHLELSVDLTSYFVTNDPGGDHFSVGVRVRFATESAQNVNGVACKLEITYAYDETTTMTISVNDVEGEYHVKTVYIPIQSHHQVITTSYVEGGTITGTANAPANQIPKLTGSGGFLPESGVSILNSWLEIRGTEGGAGTNLNMVVRLDGSTDLTRYTCEQTLNTNVTYFDRIAFLDAGGGNTDATLDDASAHAFEFKGTAANQFECVGALLVVTYLYIPASTTAVLNSIRVPLESGRANAMTPGFSSAAGDADTFDVSVVIQEPGPIILRQSGVVIYVTINNATLRWLGQGQALRSYTAASSGVRDSGYPIIQRLDHSLGTWTLARGRNTLTFSVYGAAEGDLPINGGFAVINYTSGIMLDADDLPIEGAHARTTVWPVIPTYVEVGNSSRTLRSPTAPIIAESYVLIGSHVELQFNSTNGTQSATFVAAERKTTEGAGSGWQHAQTEISSQAAECGTDVMYINNTDWWRSTPPTGLFSSFFIDPRRMDLTVARDWVVTPYYASAQYCAVQYHTFHSIYQTPDVGNVTLDGAGGSYSGAVSILGYDEITGELRHMVRDLSASSGGFHVTIYDDTLDYVAYDNGDGDTYPGASERGPLAGTSRTTALDAPKIVGRGTYGESTSTLLPTIPDHQQWDVLLMWCESNTSEAVSTPLGWTAVNDSGQNATGTRITLFAARATARGYNTIAAPTIADPGDHLLIQILCIRGAHRTASLSGEGGVFNVTWGGTAATSTSVTWTGDTTTVDRCLVLVGIATDIDGATDTDRVTNAAYTNSNLVGLRGFLGTCTALGNGGGLSVGAGVKLVAGAIGNTTATITGTSTQALLMVAMAPHDFSADETELEIIKFSGGGGGGLTPPRIGSAFIR